MKTNSASAARLTLLLSAVLLSRLGAAETNNTTSIAGSWKWNFTMPDGSQVTPRLKIRQENGQFTGTTRFRPGSEIVVTNLLVQGTNVSFEVARQREGRRTVTHYSGAWNGDRLKGLITAHRNGEEQRYDWDARRQADAEGTWKWTNEFGNFKAESSLKLKQEGDKLTGKIRARRVGETPIIRGTFQDGRISFDTERERGGETFVNHFYGRLIGDKIEGAMELNFFGRPSTNDWKAFRSD